MFCYERIHCCYVHFYQLFCSRNFNHKAHPESMFMTQKKRLYLCLYFVEKICSCDLNINFFYVSVLGPGT